MTLTEAELRKAFTDTNTAEPLAEGWPGLERFAREVERLAFARGLREGYQKSLSTSALALCTSLGDKK